MLIFDFDGVMLDSLDEVAVTAFNSESTAPAFMLEELPAGYLDLFRRNRFHAQPAADFPPLARWCIDHRQDPETLISSELYANILAQENAPTAERQARFFAARSAFVEANSELWIALNRPIQPLWDSLRTRSESVLVLTNKNKAAVTNTTQHYGLSIQPDNIYAADTGTKIENFRAIQRRFASQELCFIDDSIKNLIDIRSEISESELQLILANWGYCGPNDEAVAKRHGFGVYSQEQLLEDLSRP